jgi:dTDP-L-rhamnose 4-epimerase
LRSPSDVAEGSFVHHHILVTGGAGFIGAHLVQDLLDHGYCVRVLDNLDPQVHASGEIPTYLSKEAEFIRGDVRDNATVRAALKGIDAVCHLAAAVGVGQSMYEVARYTDVNERGTATLIEELAQSGVRKLLVASSMSIYGEGLARSGRGLVEPAPRTLEQLKAGHWENSDSAGDTMEPVPTPESKSPSLTSIYALNKYAQERMALIFGAAYDREAVAMRFFNTYGPWQALSNPYTGVLAIFASRLLNGRPPMIFEDGLQRRDFVHVRDVARACRLALESPAANGQVINVGSGASRTVLDVARSLATMLHRNDVMACVTGKYRVGDIRHCFADIGRMRSLLDFAPRISFEDGLAELAEWLSGQVAIDDVDRATEELARRGLVA